jgi:16S rRNA (guanine966-N2)-methyltransferase
MNRRIAKTGKPSRPGRLRIVAGKWRSRLLDVADAEGLRPTSERIRETLFNWLEPYVAGARCLDLFAGTGALGLEALSRGASTAVFVERSPQAVEALRRNVKTLGATGAEIRRADAFEVLQAPPAVKFDIVFLDPPFADDRLVELCRLLEHASILAGGALVYVEQDRRGPELTLPEGWLAVRSKTAGNVRYSLVKPGQGASR